MDPETFFSALSNIIRLRCLMLLVKEKELCVCEFTYVLDIAQPAVSRHLALLREAGIVRDRRDGLWIYYRVHPGLPKWALEVLRATAKGVLEQAPFNNDKKVLANMSSRPGAPRCA
ncbi:MAG TPA: metalloregulator ArsR/SmtB family transcription factor [Gammaproteobacteria bacterium]